MSVKRRLILSALVMLIVPAVLIIVLSILLIGVFMIFHPEIELSAVEGVSVSDPYIIRFIIIWAAMAVACFAATAAAIAINLRNSVLEPMRRLSDGVRHMKNGDLSYEFVGSGDRELKELFSDFEELRLRLQRNVRREIEKDDLKKTLLVNLSHDIKTPVTSIKGYIEGIRDGVANTDEMRERYLNTIYVKADLIERLADNLSVYSKLELGKMQYKMTSLDINEFIKKIAAEYEMDMQIAKMQLVTNVGDEPIICTADAENMRRVFSNIIINAIKYKNPGEGSLEISAQKNDEGIRICFADRGRGIPKEDLENVFDGFYRADASRNGAIPGNGLGLSVCKRIIADHGGKIWARNRSGGGCEFIIILPSYQRYDG